MPALWEYTPRRLRALCALRTTLPSDGRQRATATNLRLLPSSEYQNQTLYAKYPTLLRKSTWTVSSGQSHLVNPV